MATTGAVLDGAKASQTNSPQSDLPQCGVARDFKALPLSFNATLRTQAPSPIDLHGSQYAASFLDDGQTQQTEYAVWAANSSQVALVPVTTTNANTKGVAIGTGTIPQGTLPVGLYTDGAGYLNIFDEDGRAVGSILSVIVKVGGGGYYLLNGTGVTPPTVTILDSNGDPIAITTVNNAFASVDPDGGIVNLSTAAVTALGGGVSKARGDSVYQSYLVLANQTFWWSKNDSQTTRFTYDGKLQKWLPIKGLGIQNVGIVTAGQIYSLSPAPRSFALNDYLLGDATDADKYASLRVGLNATASASTPLAYNPAPPVGGFSGVKVIPDDDVEGFAFSPPDDILAGVVGLSNGKLKLNPAFVTANAGLSLWYSGLEFSTSNNGTVGPLLGAGTNPRFIAPIPAPLETPLLRIGSRRYLTAIVVKNDAALLAAPAPTDSQVLVSLSTGRLRFSVNLPKYADPDDALFQSAYLGEDVVYDGVACCGKPQPLRQPVVAVNSAGVPITDVSQADELYLPIADPFANNGLGSSGIFYLPDGTGSIPSLSVVPPARAGGDLLSDPNLGLVRRIGPRIGPYSLGDDAVYWYGGAVPTTRSVGYSSDIPTFDWDIDSDIAYITEAAATASRSQLAINGDLQDAIEGPVYYLNALYTPSAYTTAARMVSRIRNSFTASSQRSEKLYFAVNGDAFEWSSLTLPAGTSFTADQMVTALLASTRISDGALLSAVFPNAVYADRGYLVLEATVSLEIGFGYNQTLDLSGCRITGFLPGWRTIAGQDNWLPDSGLSFGMGRSPLNLARTSPAPDYIDRARTTDQVLTRSATAFPYVGIDYPPLRDVAGYGKDVFFRRIAVVRGQTVVTDLNQYVEALYDFDNSRFGWLDEASVRADVVRPTAQLNLGFTNVIPETMLGVDPNPTNGLYVAEANGPFVKLDQGSQYLLPNDGVSGTALLIDTFGAQATNGYRGVWASGSSTFSDALADFVTAGVQQGYLLTVYPANSTPQTYTVASVTNATTLVVTPAFTTTSTAGSWQCFVGEPVTDYDRAVLADAVYVPFNPLPTQTFGVYLLSPLGQTPITPAAQSANRLSAFVADALASGRAVNLRFSQEGATAALSLLDTTPLGTITNGSLILNGVGSIRYTTQSFSVLVGDTLFTHGGANLLAPVAVFSPNPVGVEYLTTTGELKFNATLLVDYAGSTVYQVSEFLPAASLAQGQAEYNTAGLINISADDIAAYPQTICYFEEALVMGTDMTVSPMSGSFYLSKPVREYQLVKVSYWQATPSGELLTDSRGSPLQVTEFLPFTVRMELATRVDAQTYSFDPPDANGQIHSLREDIEPSVYVGAELQNYGQSTTVRFDYAKRLLYLTNPVADAATAVKVSYSVYDAFGGERTFSVSTPPVFQPPFFLAAGVSSFTLAGDASTKITAGQMLRLGASTFYIKSVAYDPENQGVPTLDQPYLAYPSSAATGTTTVEIWPPTVAEAGLRSPSQQALTLITAKPITNTVDGTTTTGNAGNFLTISTSYQPVVAGQTGIVFNGPVSFTVNAPYVEVIAGQILEIDGQPYTVADSTLSEDGTQQTVTVTAPFIASYSGATARITVRPVYPEGVLEFVPVGPLAPDRTVSLILFGTNGIGQTLVQDLDWAIDPRSGLVRLLQPAQQGLLAGQKLILQWTAQRALELKLSNGIAQVPRYAAFFRYLANPSVDNGLLGSTVTATYSFKYPDSFYVRDLPLAEYLGIFAQDIVSQTRQTSGQSGGPLLTRAINPLSDNGQASLLSQRQVLVNKDRAARTFLTFYNDTIVAFEQVLEAINGEIVGDRNGKFRFYTGDAAFLPTPGLTDPFTGILTTRNVYSEVWNAAAPTGYLPLTANDRLVDPFGSFTLNNGVLEGPLPSAPLLSLLIRQQASLIRNDIDDVLLIKSSGIKYELLFTLYAKGSYERMAEPNPFSRLFPERSQGIMLTAPGLDANLAGGIKGEYSFANLDKLFTEGVRSTFLTQIAQVANPVQGDLTRLTSISVEIRTPRAWVWNFYPNGIPANSLFTGQLAVTSPCVICTVIPMGQVPVNPDTGYPDGDLFAFRGGDLPDLSTGDGEVQLPYWRSATFGYFSNIMQLEGGTPDGRVQALTASSGSFPSGNFGGLYVNEVLYGCVVTFANRLGVQITSKYQLYSLGQGFYAPQQGDTLRVRVRPDATNDDLYQTLVHKDNYDLYTQFSSGQILDITAPFIPNQTPVVPIEFLQAQVTFTNSDISPTVFPALEGKPYLDNGDYSFPFLATSNTELDRFGQIGTAVPAMVLAQDPFGNYIYPDEILFNDGAIQTAFGGGNPPDNLLTAANLTPAGVGQGPLNQHDLLLVQTTTGSPTLPASSLGFLSVGDYSVLGGGKIETPRFLSRTKKGAEIRYSIQNYMVDTAAALDIIEDRSGLPPGAAGKYVTLFDLSTGGTTVLDDGQNAGAFVPCAGGLNTFIAASATNTVTLRMFTLSNNSEGGVSYAIGDIVEEILFTQAGAFATIAGTLVAGTPEFGYNNNHLLIRFLPTPFAPAGSLLDLPTLQALPSNRFGPISNIGLIYSTNQKFGYSISVSAVNPGETLSAYLGVDRLTFADVLDFRRAQVRGTIHPDGGWDLQTKLLVEEVRAIDSSAVLHWISYQYINGRTNGDGCPFTFLDRDGTGILGTFSPASASGAGDEEGTIKVMGWEGVKPVGSGAVLVANVVAGQVTSISVTNGGSGYDGGYVELTIAAPPAPGRTATAVATVVGGVITNTTIYLAGNGYAGPTAAVTVRHFAGNQQIPATTTITASAIPSNPQDEVGNISVGDALLGSEPVLADPSADITRVQSGDIVTVRYAEDATYEATAAGGTYLVRHTALPSVVGSPFAEFDSTATAGSVLEPAWTQMDFSTLVSWDAGALEMTLDTVGRFGGIEILDGTENVPQTTLTTAEPHGYKVGESVRIGGAVTIPSINGTWSVVAVPSPTEMTITAPIGPAGFAYGGRIMESAEAMPPHLWLGVKDFGSFPNPATYLAKYGFLPRLYIVTSVNGINSTALSIEYQDAGSDPNNNLFRVVTGTAQDTNGAALTDAAFFAALSVGQTISGRVYFPLTVNRLAGMPVDNVVAYLTGTVNGFRHVRFQNTSPANVANYPIGSLTPITPYSGYVMPNTGDVGIAVCIKKDSDRFILRRHLAVYDNVLAMIDLSGVANNQAGELNGAGRPHANNGVKCLVPNDLAITSNAGADTLRLTAGIFCEPSFPVSALPAVGGPWVGGILAVTAANPAEVQLSVPHNLRAGDQVAIGGTANASLNTTWTVLAVTSANNFTVNFNNPVLLGIAGDVWGTNQPRLVDDLTSPVWLKTVGVRYAGFEQRVHYNVRRIRRFHEANEDIFAAFAALRFAYETRRGIVTGYTTTSKQTATVAAQNFVFPATDPDYLNGTFYNGTQLGGFTNPDVNVRAGDLFRLIDPTLPPSQKVIATATIKKVLSDGTLLLEAPALQAVSIVGNEFEIWLRNAVVPHQQSCDQLLDIVTERTLIDRTVNRTVVGPTYRKGGFVTVPYGPNRLADYANTVNKMQDDLLPVLGDTFSDYGLQLNDIVVVDPQGVVGTRSGNYERGVRPFGDVSIIERGGAYTAGLPAPVDDNRGFYRITKIDTATDTLTVSGTTAFGGTTSNVTYPKPVAAKPTRGYAVYPTVHASVVTTTGAEGQVALRPTSLPGLDDNNVPTASPDSYADCNYSVRPFAYRIIRPTSLLSREAIDLILTMRERMLSLIEQFKYAMTVLGGDYYTFQKNLYGRDLGFTSFPSGSGLFRNITITDLLGQMGTVPFTNDSDGLSVLDRRFWILDTRLDNLTTDGTGFGMNTTPPGTPYTDYFGTGADVRPVLPDRINIVLDYRDRLRTQRFSWITYRANRLTGSIVDIARFDQQYATARAQQIASMAQRRSLTGV